MKHWLLVGTAIVILVIVLTRSRVSTTSTLPPPATPATAPATAPATLPASAPAP